MIVCCYTATGNTSGVVLDNTVVHDNVAIPGYVDAATGFRSNIISNRATIERKVCLRLRIIKVRIACVNVDARTVNSLVVSDITTVHGSCCCLALRITSIQHQTARRANRRSIATSDGTASHSEISISYHNAAGVLIGKSSVLNSAITELTCCAICNSNCATKSIVNRAVLNGAASHNKLCTSTNGENYAVISKIRFGLAIFNNAAKQGKATTVLNGKCSVVAINSGTIKSNCTARSNLEHIEEMLRVGHGAGNSSTTHQPNVLISWNLDWSSNSKVRIYLNDSLRTICWSSSNSSQQLSL